MNPHLTDEQWRALSVLVDHAVDLDEDERARWLEQLDASHAALKPLLERAFRSNAGVETGAFLGTLPKLGFEYGVESAGSPAAGDRIGPYQLVGELGRGGMGTVWLAERSDALVRRQVALKLPHVAAHQRGLAERFAREREILATLNHPNIARLYDVGVAGGQPYLAMEYVEGQPIVAYCDGRSLSLPQRITLFMQALAAVQYAHERLVVHRDIKPSNILVTSTREVRLLDFGIAKLLVGGEAKETELTQLGGRAFTPTYASPEQILGQPIGTASDVYSLGVVLYELLAGSLPYRLKRDSRGALEDAILGADPLRPSQAVSNESAAARGTTNAGLARTLSGDLDTIINKALKKTAGERYGTAAALAEELQRYLDGRPVLARPDSVWYRASKFVARNRLIVAAAAAVAIAALLLVLTATTATVVALSVGLVAALWQARRANRQAHIAKAEARRAMAETRTAQAVKAFLQDIFRANSSAQTDPIKARQTTARELLDIGAETIKGALDDVPEAKLELLATLAALYRDLNEVDQELALRARRAAVARSTYGRSDPRLAEALIDHALALQHAPEALGLLEEARAILERNQGSTTATRGRLLNVFAIYYARRDPMRALEFAEQAVQLLRDGPVSMDLQRALFQLGRILMLRADYDRGVRVLLETVEVSNALRPQSNPMVANVFELLGICQEGLQEFSHAERSFNSSLQAAASCYGERDLRSVTAEIRLAALLCRTRPADGIPRLENARRRALGLAHANIWSLLAVLKGSVQPVLDFGRIEEARELAVDCVEQYRSLLPGSWLLAAALDLRANAALEQGRYVEAEASLGEAKRIHEHMQTNTELRIDHHAAVARLLLATNRLDEAEQALSALAAPEPDSARIPLGWLTATITHAAIMLARGNPDQALAYATHARATIAGHALRDYFVLWEARSVALEGMALRAACQPGEALPILEHSLELARSVYDADLSPSLANVYVALADCLLDLGRSKEADTWLRRASAIHTANRCLGLQYSEPLRAAERRVASSMAA
jgi:serine/threonine-protein kinase